ncbi:unnamed protein product [Aureobasidium uvarum]|uniref:Myb-like domain-containing protein n=1 Tax=Aureobasidium uvarum TaxID=2773716 RepID=A0A9N8PUG3_9PEZI|nr:unnamed protein product [Aureobasidium uvarum]
MPQQLQSTIITQPNTSIPHHNPERSSIATSISSQLSGSTQYDNSRRPSEYGHSEPPSRKRSRADDFRPAAHESPMYNTNLTLNIPTMMGSNGQHSSNHVSPFQFRAPQPSQATSTDRSPQSDTQKLQPQQTYSPAEAVSTNQHHHHRLPPHSPTLKRTKHGEEVSPVGDSGPPSMVGKEGMPEPAPRPKGPKLKFTREDDALLVRLKETKNLTWKQIAEFFPGRSAGTLQVRYCTKLKAKTTLWNDDMIQRLRTAIQDYDNDRWRFISSKVGSGFSAAACKAKAEEIEAEGMREDDGASSGSDDDQQEGADGDGVEEVETKGEIET